MIGGDRGTTGVIRENKETYLGDVEKGDSTKREESSLCISVN